MARRRTGTSALLGALALLVFLTMAGMFQHSLSRQTLSEVHRVQLASLARVQARVAIQELLGRVAADLNEPGTALFTKVREVIDDKFDELDLTALVPAPAHTLDPRWGRGEAGGGARGRVLGHKVVLRGTRAARDLGGTEEWVGVLTIAATGEMADAAATLRREVEEHYEIRTLLAGPPRPFDQVALFVGDLAAVTDAAAANTLRGELIRTQELIRAGLAGAAAAELSAEDRARLEAITAGLLPPEEVEARTPTLPEGPACFSGFYHTGMTGLEFLDLAARVREKKAAVDAKVERVRALAAGGEGLVQAIYELVDASSSALASLWLYQRTLNVMAKDSERYASAVEPFLKRLEPEHFLDRAFLRPAPEDRAFRRWLDGRDRLEGVIDATRQGRLDLTGELRGRVVLLVGPNGAHLDGLNARASRAGSRVTVVSLGGDVEVRGDVHAAVIMLPRTRGDASTVGRFRLGMGAKLTGSLIAPHATASNLQLAGKIRYDGTLLAAYPPKATLDKEGRGDYVVAVSPTPLFGDGRAK